jgi:hypothetical protein
VKGLPVEDKGGKGIRVLEMKENSIDSDLDEKRMPMACMGWAGDLQHVGCQQMYSLISFNPLKVSLLS